MVLVTSIRGRRVWVRCPYCQAVHVHDVIERGHTEHRAPGCDLYAPTTPEARAVGYLFRTTTERTAP